MKPRQSPVIAQETVREIVTEILSKNLGSRCVIHSLKIRAWMKRKKLNPKFKIPVGTWVAMAPSSVKTERGTWILVSKRKRDNRYYLTYVLRKRKVREGWTAL